MSLDPEGVCPYTDDSLPLELPSLRGPRPESRAQWLQREILPHEHALRRILARRYPGLDLDDVLQATYLRLMALPQVDQIKDSQYYFYRAAHSVVLDRARRTQTMALEPIEFDVFEWAADEPTTDDIIDSRRALEQFYEALQRLPPRQRMVVELKRFDGLSTRAIAERMGKSSRSVEVYMTKAMRQLAAAMADR